MKIFIACLCLVFPYSCDAVTLASRGHTIYSIVIPERPTVAEEKAAKVLSSYLGKITRANFRIVSAAPVNYGHEILVGGKHHPNAGLQDPDGFSIRTEDCKLFLEGGERGILYAVYAFLERYCGLRKYNEEAVVVPKIKKLKVPDNILLVENPAIHFREYYYTATVDEEYLDWHRLMQHNATADSSSWGMWVHTFHLLVPDSVYYASHPEYYSYYGGKRQPAQLCLSNPQVFEILVRNLRQAMKKKPAARYWSVSQNDNYGYCQCEKCRAVDSLEGSPSGSVIRFANQVAAEFPDKIISTLAYQYSRSAPKITRPAANVNIMFCSIECDRSKPIAFDTSKGSFARDFEDWSRLTNNILIWDYVVQFANYISPFPNLKVLQPNIQFFHEHGVSDLFEQGSSVNWSDFGELKAYLIAAWLWNPSANADSLYRDFLDGYYGPAGIPILKYIRLLEKNMDDSHVMLDIYGNPVTPVRSWLKPEQVDSYLSLMNEAAALVKKNPVFARRVQRANLPLRYTVLEQAKLFGTGNRGVFARDPSGKWAVRPDVKASVTAFVDDLKSNGITSLNENHYSPDRYLADWQRIFEHGMIDHLAMNRKIIFEIPYSPKYPAKGDSTLTDGIGGYDDYHYNWLGWEGTDMVAVVDLGTSKKIDSLSCDFMEDQKSWIFMPERVSYFVSEDGTTFLPAGKPVEGNDPKPNKNFNTRSYTLNPVSPVNARYVKVVAQNRKTCPSWHIGAGYNSWIFCDEIVVR